MSAHVLLNLLKQLGKRDKMRGLPSVNFIECTTGCYLYHLIISSWKPCQHNLTSSTTAKINYHALDFAM